ncbi:hypothetical protein [Histidinibacterium lentulum]|uniref:Uncharacterized protein n=1 Tax=Histidinibacterium lentulum TaxID=2480588 RepID=A0A3N2QYF2_9RHOB|nr:hypothetical protein [Histidinibacterium lentulum]ROU00173.1 hypothetical protein EAT49_12760 [Histidinibacterium lentulum]
MTQTTRPGPERDDHDLQHLVSDLFGVSSDIRYVSLLRAGRLHSRQRDGISESSSVESDRYEELFVNPALLNLAANRGNLDCGGLAWLVVRYGHFQQFILPIRDGHLSVCLELRARPEEHAEPIRQLLAAHLLEAQA